MREIKLGICFFDKDDKILAMKPLEAKWSVDLEQDLKEKHSIYVLDEIANILTSGLKLTLTPEPVKEMLEKLKEFQCQE